MTSFAFSWQPGPGCSRRRTRGAGHRTGSDGGPQPGGDGARPGDAARSPASNHAAYPGNSGSAGGPSLGDAEISECPAPLRPAPRPRFPQPPLGPRRHAHAGATRAAASAPLAGLGIHGCRAWSRRSARFKRIPEAPWRETKVTNEIKKSNDIWGVRTWSVG
jgi:hypothetical protein